MHGRHAVNGHNESATVAGFDGIAAATVALGKTHMIAVNRNGLVYTSGMNNLNQCGRDTTKEHQLGASSTVSHAAGYSSLTQDSERTPSPKCNAPYRQILLICLS